MDQNPNSVYSGSDQSDVIFVLAAFIFSFQKGKSEEPKCLQRKDALVVSPSPKLHSFPRLSSQSPFSVYQRSRQKCEDSAPLVRSGFQGGHATHSFIRQMWKKLCSMPFISRMFSYMDVLPRAVNGLRLQGKTVGKSPMSLTSQSHWEGKWGLATAHFDMWSDKMILLIKSIESGFATLATESIFQRD